MIPLSQAVAEYGVSRSTLYEAIKAGRLKRYRRVGERKTLLDRRELRRLVAPRVIK